MNINELDTYDLGDAVKFNDELNQRLFDESERLRPEVRQQLLRIAEDFREFLGIKDIELKDITISGSNAAYTYTPHSDIDLHLVVDLPEADASEVYRELFDAKKYAYNDMHNIKIGGYDVELYVQDANKTHHSQGIYSIMNDDWVSVPKRRRPDVDDISVKSKFEDLGHRIESVIASGDYEKITAMANKIKEYRQAGLDAHGEFGPENLAFKILRTQGLIEKLYAARNQAKDRLLSLDERKKKRKKKVKYGYGGYWYPGTAYAGQDHPAGTEGGDGGDGGGESLREDAGMPTDEQILKDFVNFCVKELKIENMPRIHLRKDPQWPKVNKTFGRYRDDTKTLEVAWGQRHVMDILRTVAHELTHKHQHEREGERMGPDAGETGSPYENEANARAGILMRDYGRLHPEYFAVGQAHDLEESASGYIPTKRQAKDPRYVMALTKDIRPGQVGKEANKLKLKTDSQGHPQIANPNGLFEQLMREYQAVKEKKLFALADEDYSPDAPPGPESKPTMPAGTLRVDVSDVYDWYKLGQHISNMKGLGQHDFGKGPPSSIISFGDEDTEHKFIQDIKATGLDVTDIDPKDPKRRPGKTIKTDPTYNVDETIQAPVSKEQRAAEDYYRFIVGKIKLGRVLNRQEQEFFKTYNLKKKLAEFAPSADRGDDGEGSDYLTQLANRWWNAADPRDQRRIADVIRTFGYEITQVESEDDAVQLTDIKGKADPIFISADEFDPDLYEVSDERLQTYLSRAGQQVDRRQERMARARERLNKGYEIYHAEDPTRIVHRFEANTPAEARRYYEKYNANYESDRDYDLKLRRATGLMETAQSESEQHHGWRAELVDEITPTTFEVHLTNQRSRESANFVVRPVDMIRPGLAGKFSIDSMDLKDLQTGATRSIQSDSNKPWVYILDAVSALFWDTPALQAKLQAQLKAHQDQGLPMLPGLKQRRSAGQAMPVKDFVQGQQAAKDAVARAQRRKDVQENDANFAAGMAAKKAGGGATDIMLAQPNIAKNQQYLDRIAAAYGLPAGLSAEQIKAKYQAASQQRAIDDIARKQGLPAGMTKDQLMQAWRKKVQGQTQSMAEADGDLNEDEDLDEVKMSPGALEKFATSPEAKGIRAGFEAELIFRDTQGESDEMDPEPDYDADERAYSIQQVIEFFENDEYGYGLSDRERNRLEEGLDETYMNWRDEQIISDFRNDAEDLIRDILLEETPMDQRIHFYLTDSLQMSDEEADAVIKAGAEAPKFTNSTAQKDYADENPEYKAYLEAADEAEQELEESVEFSVNRQDEYWDEALDKYRDDYSGDDDSFFSDVGLRWMSDIANEFNLDWPVWNMDARGNDGSRDWEEIGSSLQDAIDMPVKVSSGYHTTTRREGQWIIEPDGSLDPDDKSEEVGLEIVSPPMPLLTAIEKLKQVVDWANDPNGGNAYTNSTTGLHMGVSLPSMKSEAVPDDIGIDYVKLILFMGDKYVQQQFGREANTYCASALDKLRQNIKGKKSDPAGVVDILRHGLTELAHRELQKGVGTSKYTSAHIQPGYIEFRSPGGDWLAKADEEIGVLENTMLRFARAMAIAGDPTAERQEYAKKLYKLVTADNPEYADQLKLFAEFSAGTINKEQLKKQWAETVLQKEIPGAGQEEYEVYGRNNKDNPNGVVATFYARDYDDAYDQFLRKYGANINDLDVRIKQPWFDVFDDKGQVVKTLRAKDIDKATERAQYDFGERWTDAWNIYRRPDDTPEPKATPSPRAQVAKRIVTKPKTPTEYNYDIIDQRTLDLKAIDRFYAANDQEASRVFDQWLKMKNLPNDTANYGYRRSAQSRDARKDSADLQRRLGVQDVDIDVTQNFDPSAYERNSERIEAIRAQAQQPRQNYELVQHDDTDRVIHRMNNATADEVRAWIDQQEQGGMPPGFLRTRIVAESIDPVSGAGAVAPRQDPKNTSKKTVEPVEKTFKQPVKSGLYRSAIGQAINQKDLENMTQQIQVARKLGDSVMEMEETPPEVMRALDQAAQKNGYKNWADVKANPKSQSAVMTVAKLANAILRTTGPHHEKIFYKSKTDENFADGKVSGKSRPGRVKRAGASCAGSVTDLRARAKKYGGEKGRMYHWCANMKSGKKK